MAKVDNTFSFSISERGESTGQMFNWSFTAKRMLSIRDRITKDSVRRQLIGDNSQNAETTTVMRAEVLALLQVSITESPKGWKDSNGGLELFDDNIVVALYEKIVSEQNAAIEEASKVSDEAKEKLRKTARAKKPEDEEETVKE